MSADFGKGVTETGSEGRQVSSFRAVYCAADVVVTTLVGDVVGAAWVDVIGSGALLGRRLSSSIACLRCSNLVAIVE